MGNYTESYHHLVWATKRREPFITPEVEPVLYDHLRHQRAPLGVVVHAINGMPDHAHVVCSLPPSLVVSTLLGKIKGASAWLISQRAQQGRDLQMCLYWQHNYVWLTFSKHDLPRIAGYVDSQKVHHQSGRLLGRLERCDDGYDSSAPEGLRSV